MTKPHDSDVDKQGGSTRRPLVVYTVIIGAAVLVIATVTAVTYWFAVQPTTGIASNPSVAETIPTTEPDEATSAALIVLDGATQVRRDPGAYWSFSVAYALREKHPASNAIQQISSRLEALGWRPIKDDWLNPGLPSSHVRGWTDFRDSTTTPTQHVHQWGAQWQDKSGSIVGYTLRYSYPESATPDFESLWINGSWYPAAGVKIMKAATHQ